MVSDLGTFCCLAHKHTNAIEEIECSATFQLKQAQTEIESLNAHIKVLEDDDHEWYLQAAELERLTALTEADGKEIGSYRKETGLRGELKNKDAELERQHKLIRELNEHYGGQADRIEKLEKVLRNIQQHRHGFADATSAFGWVMDRVDEALQEPSDATV